MVEMQKWHWLIMASIALVALVKIIVQLVRWRAASRSLVRAGQQNHGTTRQSNAETNNNGTGPMVYFANDNHRQKDKEYRFSFQKVNGSWRAYILKMPSLGRRDPCGIKTHRIFENNRPYVCWDKPVASLKGMQDISRVWADGIQEYIATGKKFG